MGEERLTPRDGAVLLELARAAIRDATRGSGTVDDLVRRLEIGPALRIPRSVFVTLRSPAGAGDRGPLRGCIGTLAADLPLYENVIRTAPRSALEDPRFAPLTAAEVDGLSIEISALTPLRRIASIDEIAIGRDGVRLTGQGRHSVFLPQVALEQRWAAEQLVEQLALKAGLARDAWRDAELQVFQAEVFEQRGASGDQVPRGGSKTR